MHGKMKAALKAEAAPGAKFALLEIPKIGLRDVLIQVKAASICGTDLHIYEWDAWAQSRMTVPRIFGHEFAGEVVAVGSEVTSLVPGDFVAAETHITCGLCYQCRTGQAHVCRNVQILGVDRDGAFAEYIAIPENIATTMGANYVLNPRKVDPVRQVLDVTDGLGVDVVLEMSGNAQAIRQSFKVLRNGGRVSLLGIPPRTVELDLANDIIFKGATVFGISGRRIFDTWYRTRRILEAGQLDLKQVITHTLSFDQLHEAMEIMKAGDCGKIVMTM